ncbi:MAG TPA: bifunctional DNA-formamidopyrimidine glycosylase/DNA-(apurinic or apyrimidinic site) lyase [Chromatiales bacterium]|nr:bifunctional DNA-formamidopyrimidine glycosylase/DNA-(apurinic or apyrimidinic site) lyase [Chromatiales bacterium]
MPELPEVETTRRGIARHVTGRTVTQVVVRNPHLRRPVPGRLQRELPGQVFTAVERRGKYLLLRAGTGTVLAHLGMSGVLRVIDARVPPGKHDHVDFVMSGGRCLRFTDPRRFGLVLWTRCDPLRHPLLRHLGPEPLRDAFDGAYLFACSRGRRVAVKAFIMDARVVVGVGNIYANEALFAAGIDPRRAAGRISRQRHERLAACVKAILKQAIERGGTTLRDFSDSEGRPGYFAQELMVYGREGAPCKLCGATLRRISQGQRSTWYCPRCQS